MEARAAFHGTRSSKKAVWAMVALIAALLIVGIGGFAIRATSASVTPAGHIVLGLGLATEPGSAWNFTSRRAGTQSVEGPAPTDAPEQASPRRGGTLIYP